MGVERTVATLIIECEGGVKVYRGPALRVVPQMWVKPKKSKVSGFPSPSLFRRSVA